MTADVGGRAGVRPLPGREARPRSRTSPGRSGRPSSRRIPDAVETFDPADGLLAIGTGPVDARLPFAIIPHTAHVNLQLADGADLPNPDGRIEGTGKRIRHVKVRSVEDASSPLAPRDHRTADRRSRARRVSQIGTRLAPLAFVVIGLILTIGFGPGMARRPRRCHRAMVGLPLPDAPRHCDTGPRGGPGHRPKTGPASIGARRRRPRVRS